MGKGASLSTQIQGHTRGDGNWFICGRGSRDSGASRNLAQEALSAHRGNGGSELEQQNQGKKHKDTPFPISPSNRGFWKLLWDVITTDRESRWPGAYLAWEDFRHLCVHFSVVWQTLVTGKHCLKSRAPIAPCVIEPLRNRHLSISRE